MRFRLLVQPASRGKKPIDPETVHAVVRNCETTLLVFHLPFSIVFTFITADPRSTSQLQHASNEMNSASSCSRPAIVDELPCTQVAEMLMLRSSRLPLSTVTPGHGGRFWRVFGSSAGVTHLQQKAAGDFIRSPLRSGPGLSDITRCTCPGGYGIRKSP